MGIMQLCLNTFHDEIVHGTYQIASVLALNPITYLEFSVLFWWLWWIRNATKLVRILK